MARALAASAWWWRRSRSESRALSDGISSSLGALSGPGLKYSKSIISLTYMWMAARLAACPFVSEPSPTARTDSLRRC